jgi:hypothetical protein
MVVESLKRHAPAAEAPAVDAIPAVGDSLESGGGTKKAMEAASPARAKQEYLLAIVVTCKALVAEETVAEASTGSHARTHTLALEELQCKEAERRVCLDTVLGGLGLLHQVNCRFLCISPVGLSPPSAELVEELPARDLSSSLTYVIWDLQEETKAAKKEALAAK